MKRKELATKLRILVENVEHYEPLNQDTGEIADELERLLREVNEIYEAGEELSV